MHDSRFTLELMINCGPEEERLKMWKLEICDDFNLAMLSQIDKLNPFQNFPPCATYVVSHGGGCCDIQSEHTLQRPVLYTNREAVPLKPQDSQFINFLCTLTLAENYTHCYTSTCKGKTNLHRRPLRLPHFPQRANEAVSVLLRMWTQLMLLPLRVIMFSAAV